MNWWNYWGIDENGNSYLGNMIAEGVADPDYAAAWYQLPVARIVVTGQNSGYDPSPIGFGDVTWYPMNNVFFQASQDTYLPYCSSRMIYDGDGAPAGWTGGYNSIVSHSTQGDTNTMVYLPYYIGVSDDGQYGFVKGGGVRPVMVPPPVDSGEITPLEGLVFVVLAATGMNYAFSAIAATTEAAAATTTSTVMAAGDAASYQAIAEAAMQDAAAAYAESAAGLAQTAATAAASDAAAAAYTQAVAESQAAAAATEQATALAQDAIAQQQMAEAAGQALQQHAVDIAQALDQQAAAATAQAIDQQAAAAAQAIDDAEAAQAFADSQANQQLIDLSQQLNVTAEGSGSSVTTTVTEVPTYPEYQIDYPMDPIPTNGVYVPPAPSWFEQLAAQALKQGQSMLTSKALASGLAAILGTRTSPPTFAKSSVIAARTVQAAPPPANTPIITRLIGAGRAIVSAPDSSGSGAAAGSSGSGAAAGSSGSGAAAGSSGSGAAGISPALLVAAVAYALLRG